jgi:hypothetical protein
MIKPNDDKQQYRLRIFSDDNFRLRKHDRLKILRTDKPARIFVLHRRSPYVREYEIERDSRRRDALRSAAGLVLRNATVTHSEKHPDVRWHEYSIKCEDYEVILADGSRVLASTDRCEAPPFNYVELSMKTDLVAEHCKKYCNGVWTGRLKAGFEKFRRFEAKCVTVELGYGPEDIVKCHEMWQVDKIVLFDAVLERHREPDWGHIYKFRQP